MQYLIKFRANEIFLDANIFLYNITAHHKFGPPCQDFISKIEKGKFKGFTSNWVMTEIVHKVMMIETCERFQIKIHEAVNYLKKHPRTIKNLSKFRVVLDLIYHLSNLTILEINTSIFQQSHSMINKYQLLSSDAIHVSTCLHYGINHIATNDTYFERVKSIKVWRP